MLKKSKDKYKNFIKYIKILIKNNTIKLALAFFMMILISIGSILQPFLFKEIIDKTLIQKNFKLLLYLCTIIILISLLSSIFNISLNIFFSKIKRKNSNYIRNIIFKKLYRQSGKYFVEKKTGELIYILDNDLYNIENFGLDWIFREVLNIFTAVSAFIILLRMNRIILLAVISLQLILLILNIIFNTKITNNTNEVRNIAGNISDLTEEFIANISNIVISKGEKFLWRKIISKEREFLNKSLCLDFMISFSTEIYALLDGFLIIAIYLFGGRSLSIGQIIAFVQYTNLLLKPSLDIFQDNTKIQQILISINRVFGVIDESSDINYLNRKGQGYKIIKGNIEFKNVNFRYKEKLILEKFNLCIKNGEISAIVGESGSGKSTLARLIFRLWDIKEGEILIDGINIKSISLHFLRNNIEYIEQDVFLFNDTFLNNLVMNKKDYKMDQVIEICKKVGIYDLIKSQVDGFNTIIGERGVKLSGGEKQRISIARGLIRESPIIIFDESTSALDNISQIRLFDEIKPLLKGKTVIIIAHRLSTVEKADQIYVMKNGKIVENGRHKDLCNAKGFYYYLLTLKN